MKPLFLKKDAKNLKKTLQYEKKDDSIQLAVALIAKKREVAAE